MTTRAGLAVTGIAAGILAAGLAHAQDGVRVSSPGERWHYLDATLDLKPRPIRFFFPASGACRSALRNDAGVSYAGRGPLGEIRNEAGELCEPLGIASLQAWRDRSSRPRTESPVPRAHTTFRVVHRDGEFAYVRGRFPLAVLVGWTQFDDTIALLPNSEGCEKPMESGRASMEFRYWGKVPYRLVAGGKDCPILGFVSPIGPQK